MEKMINFVKNNKKTLGKGALVVGGGIAVAVLTKLGLQPVEEDYVEAEEEYEVVDIPEEDIEIIDEESLDE